ncbi:uncharacterized protein si:ch211-152p11.4 isoform X1 [Hippocampus zosterae]|uniref:uncharacterized protein si:ch211-152p11.4 isoform X1 n=1 Tax=Hippocampus zosterae TaxID=109293 RepID=UPI00223CFF27|nr:uncharacterized protein si:ch211-152p11.4 isoform X1 [Hippocampus zosterae]XP_051925838.1 uncharacterized protein si:ch211-152p11.4 isoform X1 [Hippocampus zosterae]
MATLRRFRSEGSLLDLDFFSWRKVDLKRTEHEDQRDYGTSSVAEVEEDAEQLPAMQEPSACKVSKKELTKELSVSAENLRDLQEKKSKSHHLEVAAIGEGCRAYSDSQLAPAAKESIGGVEREDFASPSTTSAAHPFVLKSQHRAKLSAAKLHLKSLFGQSPHSSNSNLSNTEHKDSAKERRARLLFMRQWSQVGHSKRHAISREELERWAQSLDNLLDSQTGVLVFEAFLRSEFSEENLQFYLACQQYKHSSNNFSLQRRAKDICATYILAGSPREVRAPSFSRLMTQISRATTVSASFFPIVHIEKHNEIGIAQFFTVPNVSFDVDLSPLGF